MDKESERRWARRRTLRAAGFAMVGAAMLLLVRIVMQPHATDDFDTPEERASRGGLWGAATASVNWCEGDYLVTTRVAEFWNSLSSVFIIYLGAYGLWRHSFGSRGTPAEFRHALGFAAVMIVGVGSVLFHGTLWRSMQLMDELPMIWGNSVFLYIVRALEDPRSAGPRRAEAIFLAVWTVLTTLAVIFFDDDNQNVFLFSYAGGVVYEALRTMVLDSRHNSKSESALFEVSLLCYFGGLLAWTIDRNFCSVVRPLHLHALWHIGAGTGTYTCMLTWIYLRSKSQKMNPRECGALPVTRWIAEES